MSKTARRVSARELREEFNAGEYYERVLADELIATVESEHRPQAAANEPLGTRSQMVWYYDTAEQRVALVHQYLRPDGSLGGSGRPDPKRLLVGGEILFCGAEAHPTVLPPPFTPRTRGPRT